MLSDVPVFFFSRDEGPAGDLMRMAKSQGNRRALRAILDRLPFREALPSGSRVLVPVPPVRSRLLARGLSVPDAVAAALSFSTGLPCAFSGIRRTDARSQKGLGRLSRGDGAGRFAGDFWPGPTLPSTGLVLVDDLFVTGSTLRFLSEFLSGRGMEVCAMVALLCREKHDSSVL